MGQLFYDGKGYWSNSAKSGCVVTDFIVLTWIFRDIVFCHVTGFLFAPCFSLVQIFLLTQITVVPGKKKKTTHHFLISLSTCHAELAELWGDTTCIFFFKGRAPRTQLCLCKLLRQFFWNQPQEQRIFPNANNLRKINTDKGTKNSAKFSPCLPCSYEEGPPPQARSQISSSVTFLILTSCAQSPGSPRALCLRCLRVLSIPHPQQPLGLSPRCRVPFPLPHLLWWCSAALGEGEVSPYSRGPTWRTAVRRS